MGGKRALKTIIKETEYLITTGCVFYCYERQINGVDGYQVKIEDLTDEQLNQRYAERDWWVEDGDLCLR